MRKRPYTGTTDGAAPGKRGGTEWLSRAIRTRWGFDNLGTWVVRDMRGKPGVLSVHATGRAMDIGYMNNATSRAKAVEVIDWLAANAGPLGIEAIHDYAHGRYGRGWRCDRGRWKRYTKRNNAGSIGGRFFHVEISPARADNANVVKAVWDSLVKPGKG